MMAKLTALLKTGVITVLALCAAVAAVLPASAQVLDPVCSETPNATVCQENRRPQDPRSNNLYGSNGVLTNIARILSYVTGIVAVFVMIVGGVKFITSGGNPEGVSSARNTLIFGAVGLLVAIAAQAIIITVLVKL